MAYKMWDPYMAPGNYLWTADPHSTIQQVFYQGDKCVVATERHTGYVYRNGVIMSSPTLQTVYLKLRRNTAHANIYSHGTVTYSNENISLTRVAALWASIPSSGGTSGGYADLRTVSAADPESLIPTIEASLNGMLGEFVYDEHPVDFGDLSWECAKQLRYVEDDLFNVVFDVLEWRNFHAMWKSLVNLRGWKKALSAFKRLASPRKWRRHRKAIIRDLVALFTPGSSSYLFTKYAVLPTVSDCRRLVIGIHRFVDGLPNDQQLHSRRITSLTPPPLCDSAQHTAVMTVSCAPYPTWFSGRLQSLIGEIKKWGIYPTVSNLWDILPYSFVIDWFVQYGDFFQDVDRFLYVKNYFPIHHVVMSEKWEYQVPAHSLVPDSIPVTGAVDFTYYVRWISRELPLPSVSLEAETTADKHLLEATALILQRIRP
jgi:hypothetical protein